MKIKEYVDDKNSLIVFFILLMSFVSTVIYLDDRILVSFSNIIYLNFVCFLFFIGYLTYDFFKVKKFFEQMKMLPKINDDEFLNSMPNPLNNEQAMYKEVVMALYRRHHKKLQSLHDDKKEQSEFITSWVHSIKTPITTSRLIIQNSGTKDILNTLSSLEDEIDKIDSYVEQSLYFSRIDSFSKDYIIKEYDLNKIIKEVVKKNAKSFIYKKISVEVFDSNELVLTDRKWLSFIIDQVVSNSLKYTSNGGKIKFYFDKKSKNKTLIIEDNGTGIREEDLSRVFDMGFTGYNGRNFSKSTGIGLYLSKKLALKLGHDISLESKFNEFTKVKIIFPKLIDYYNVTKL